MKRGILHSPVTLPVSLICSPYISTVLDQFTSLGYVGPLKVLTQAQCRGLLAEYKRNDYPLIPDWPKALAASSANVFRIATQVSILEPVKALLGNDVILWGSYFVRRQPGQQHPWHNDIESSVLQGKTVSVWIGIDNTTQSSALQIVTGSHLFHQSIQEVRHLAGVDRENAVTDEVMRWAHERNADSKLVIPEIADGDALFFDGWLWHASHNIANKTRTALLLQYATPDTPIRIPDPNNFEWPFKTLQHPKPPCIMISGSDHFGVNRIVPPPPSHDGREMYTLTNQIYTIDIPLASDDKTGWKPYHIFRGSTPNLQGLTCHVSALNPGQTPHPPHQHREEEILILLRGETEVTLPDLASKGLSTTVTLKPGEFVYYPAWFYHTITARGDVPANYLMFKWYNRNGEKAEGQNGGKEFSIPDSQFSKKKDQVHKLEYGKHTVADYYNDKRTEKLFYTSRVFQAPTNCLHALQCHTSVVLPGGGYASHMDAHDVAIVLLKGEIETLNERVGPNSVIFFPAGQLHDMHNPTQENAEYLVFEFHGNHPPPVKRKRKTLWDKMKDPKSWRNKFSEITNRFR